MTTEATSCSDCGAVLNGYRNETFDESGSLLSTRCFDCARDNRRRLYQETGVITTQFMIDACCSRNTLAPERLAVNRIQERARQFEQNVWFAGLRSHLGSHPERGESLELAERKMLTYVMAGRVLITIDSKEASVTLITTDEKDDRPKMGLQGICATEAQALDLLDWAERAWRDGHRTKPDTVVRIVGT